MDYNSILKETLHGKLDCLALRIFSPGYRDEEHLNLLISLATLSKEKVKELYSMEFLINTSLHLIRELPSIYKYALLHLSKLTLPKRINSEKKRELDKKTLGEDLEKLMITVEVIRKLYHICNISTNDEVFTDVETLVPYKDNMDEYYKTISKFKNSHLDENLITAMKERDHLIKEVQMKNSHLHDIIVAMRTTIKDISSLLETNSELACELCDRIGQK